MAGSSSSDFEEFNKQTDDAWDGGDDDLLLEAFNVRISRRDVQSAATQVSYCSLTTQIFFYVFRNSIMCMRRVAVVVLASDHHQSMNE